MIGKYPKDNLLLFIDDTMDLRKISVENMTSRRDLDCEKATSVNYNQGSQCCGTADVRQENPLADAIGFMKDNLNNKVLKCASGVQELSELQHWLKFSEFHIPESVKNTLLKIIYKEYSL